VHARRVDEPERLRDREDRSDLRRVWDEVFVQEGDVRGESVGADEAALLVDDDVVPARPELGEEGRDRGAARRVDEEEERAAGAHEAGDRLDLGSREVARRPGEHDEAVGRGSVAAPCTTSRSKRVGDEERVRPPGPFRCAPRPRTDCIRRGR
jgi:hypothetical protein